MTWRGSTTVTDRIFACLPYLLPLVDGIVFGKYLFFQFPILEQVLLLPLTPLIFLYHVIPFGSLIIFFALFLGVVRNENINHFIRFNTMQAILIDIVMILCSIIMPFVVKVLPSSFIVETLFNVIFLGLLGTFVYVIVQSAQGRYAEIPTISDAVYMQVR
jgi:uncharacterized membrane protein